MSTTTPWIPDEPVSKEELLALTARMRAVSNATYDLFFTTGMGGDVHAFIEFCGLLSKYVDICHRCAEQGVDFRLLNTHLGQSLPVEVHDMRYLGEKLDCIFGPAIRANPEAQAALMGILFGDRATGLLESDAKMMEEAWHLLGKASARLVEVLAQQDAERIAHVVTRQELIETRELLRQAAACVPEWGFPYKALPYKELRQRIEAVLAAPVPEFSDEWAKPRDQPATGPLRRKLGIARGVLMTVLDSTTIGGAPMPTQAELRQAIDETADP